jgi:hypothetical protein
MMKNVARVFSGAAPLAVVLTLMLLTVFGCQDNPESSTLGKEYINSQSRVTLIDSFSVKLSTVLLDTIVTSNTGTILVGRYHDDLAGDIASESYLQLGIPGDFTAESGDLYDSLRLVLTYNQSAFGDTTKPQRIIVHRLTEEIEYEYGSSISSKASFTCDPTPIGALTFTPSPGGSSTTISIPMDDNLGRDLLKRLADGSESMTDDATFHKYLPGLVLKPDPSYAGNIVGFTAAAADVRLVLYSRLAETLEDNPITFALDDSTLQFNHITHDFASTPLAGLSRQRYGLSSEKSGGYAFLQGGVGLAIRVDFPTLSEALLLSNSAVLAARLTISPKLDSYRISTLPSALVMYRSDGVNTLGTALATSTSNVDEIYGEETTFSFDLSSYIREQLASSYINPENGLLITLPASSLSTEFVRFIGDAHTKNMKLSLYFLNY